MPTGMHFFGLAKDFRKFISIIKNISFRLIYFLFNATIKMTIKTLNIMVETHCIKRLNCNVLPEHKLIIKVSYGEALIFGFLKYKQN